LLHAVAPSTSTLCIHDSEALIISTEVGCICPWLYANGKGKQTVCQLLVLDSICSVTIVSSANNVSHAQHTMVCLILGLGLQKCPWIICHIGRTTFGGSTLVKLPSTKAACNLVKKLAARRKLYAQTLQPNSTELKTSKGEVLLHLQ